MRKRSSLALLVALAALTGGCWNDDDKKSTATTDDYSVTVTGADVVNKDTGQPVAVGGLPLEGGTLNLN